MKRIVIVVATAGLCAGVLTAEAADRKPAPEGAATYILWPYDGTTVHGPFWLRMGLTPSMGIAPAGVAKEGTGHHHVLIDADLPPMDEPVPNDKNHLHFGAGQTEARLDLPPGKHTLQLLFCDERHVPFDPPVVSKKITVTVLQ
jgi:Domain of unknown function (DUF4399)